MVSMAIKAEDRHPLPIERRCVKVQSILATTDEECLHLLLVHDGC